MQILTPEVVSIETLLDCTMNHKAESLRAFLQAEGQKKSGTKSEVRERIRELLEQDLGKVVRLTEHLNRVEGWGNQHLYLYTIPAGICRKWRDQEHVKEVLKANKVSHIMNHPRPVVLPDKPTLASVEWSPSRVRMIWNEKRTWKERREDQDEPEGENGFIFYAYERKKARGTLSFDWDLVTGEAMLMIQRLPSGTNYEEVRDRMLDLLKQFIDVEAFAQTRVSPAIKPILESGEVLARRTNWETLKGGKVAFTSPGRTKSVDSDGTLRAMEAAGKEDLQGSLGNVYWLASSGSKLKDPLHTVLHKKDQRVSVMGEREEEEVRYVTGRIRAHCG